MLFAGLVSTSRRVSETRSRLEKTGALASLLRRLAPEEIDIAVAYLSGHLRQGRIGIGGAAVRGARPGSAAEAPSLTLLEVDAIFERIAGISGAGSTAARVGMLSDLLGRATREEQDFLVRLIYGELRQGALAGLMAEALERLGEAAFELKLDGARVQVHKAGDDVRVYSRRGNDVTHAVPELVESVQALPARQLLLDGEVIALKPDGAPHPFQITMRRFGRKLDVPRLRGELPAWLSASPA